MKTGPGGWFVQTGCFVCHSISSLGVKSPAQIGPGPVDRGRGRAEPLRRTIDEFLANPTGTMSVVLSRQIILTPEQKQTAIQKLREAFAEHQRQRGAGRHAGVAGQERRRVTCEPLQPDRVGGCGRAPPPRRARRPTSRQAISTSTTCSRRAATQGRSTSTACRRCGTSRRSPSSRPTRPPATASTTTARRCSASLTWGDAHHPALSETKGDYDGRWLFINEMNGPHRAHRPARLQDQADPRADPEPHGNPRLVVRHAEHRVRDDGDPLLGAGAAAARRRRQVRHRLQGHHRRRQDRSRSPARCRSRWQILMPPFDYDLGDAGKRPSDGWMFFTSYNTERATGKLEVTAVAARSRTTSPRSTGAPPRRRSPTARPTSSTA